MFRLFSEAVFPTDSFASLVLISGTAKAYWGRAVVITVRKDASRHPMQGKYNLLAIHSTRLRTMKQYADAVMISVPPTLPERDVVVLGLDALINIKDDIGSDVDERVMPEGISGDSTFD